MTANAGSSYGESIAEGEAPYNSEADVRSEFMSDEGLEPSHRRRSRVASEAMATQLCPATGVDGAGSNTDGNGAGGEEEAARAYDEAMQAEIGRLYDQLHPVEYGDKNEAKIA